MRKISLHYIYSFVVLIALFSVALFPISLFAETEGIELNPAIFEEKAEPGKTYTFTLKVTNSSDIEKTFYLAASDISGVDEAGRPQFAEEGEPTPYDLSQWISFPDSELVLGAGETRGITFRISVPLDATPGGHFGGVFVETVPPRLRTIGAGVGVRVGSIVNLQIAGDVEENARIRSFSTDKLVYDALPVVFDMRFENLGNTLLRPTGFVEVIDMFGKEVANLQINESAAGVFPKSERTLSVQWEDADFAFGRYQVLVSAVYGDEIRKTLTATASFWVLPTKPILTVLGSLVAFFLVLYFGVSFYIRRKLREMGVTGASQSVRAQKYRSSLTRTMVSVVSVIVVVLILLAGLFWFFA